MRWRIWNCIERGWDAFCIISFEVTSISQVISSSCLGWIVTVMPLALASLVGRGDEVSDC